MKKAKPELPKPEANEKPLDPRKEHITDEELNRIKTLQSKAVYAATLAEKAYAEAKVAELEVNNFTLTVYNKYKLASGKDTITTEGLIIRLEEEATQEV